MTNGRTRTIAALDSLNHTTQALKEVPTIPKTAGRSMQKGTRETKNSHAESDGFANTERPSAQQMSKKNDVSEEKTGACTRHHAITKKRIQRNQSVQIRKCVLSPDTAMKMSIPQEVLHVM